MARTAANNGLFGDWLTQAAKQQGAIPKYLVYLRTQSPEHGLTEFHWSFFEEDWNETDEGTDTTGDGNADQTWNGYLTYISPITERIDPRGGLSTMNEVRIGVTNGDVSGDQRQDDIWDDAGDARMFMEIFMCFKGTADLADPRYIPSPGATAGGYICIFAGEASIEGAWDDKDFVIVGRAVNRDRPIPVDVVNTLNFPWAASQEMGKAIPSVFGRMTPYGGGMTSNVDFPLMRPSMVVPLLGADAPHLAYYRTRPVVEPETWFDVAYYFQGSGSAALPIAELSGEAADPGDDPDVWDWNGLKVITLDKQVRHKLFFYPSIINSGEIQPGDTSGDLDPTSGVTAAIAARVVSGVGKATGWIGGTETNEGAVLNENDFIRFAVRKPPTNFLISDTSGNRAIKINVILDGDATNGTVVLVAWHDDTSDDLINVTSGPTLKVDGALDNSTTTIPLTDDPTSGADPIAAYDVIDIDGEKMIVNTPSANQVTVYARGDFGTAAAAHSDLDDVSTVASVSGTDSTSLELYSASNTNVLWTRDWTDSGANQEGDDWAGLNIWLRYPAASGSARVHDVHLTVLGNYQAQQSHDSLPMVVDLYGGFDTAVIDRVKEYADGSAVSSVGSRLYQANHIWEMIARGKRFGAGIYEVEALVDGSARTWTIGYWQHSIEGWYNWADRFCKETLSYQREAPYRIANPLKSPTYKWGQVQYKPMAVAGETSVMDFVEDSNIINESLVASPAPAEESITDLEVWYARHNITGQYQRVTYISSNMEPTGDAISTLWNDTAVTKAQTAEDSTLNLNGAFDIVDGGGPFTASASATSILFPGDVILIDSEIMVVKSVSGTSVTVYDSGGSRNEFETIEADHSSGADIYILRITPKAYGKYTSETSTTLVDTDGRFEFVYPGDHISVQVAGTAHSGATYDYFTVTDVDLATGTLTLDGDPGWTGAAPDKAGNERYTIGNIFCVIDTEVVSISRISSPSAGSYNLDIVRARVGTAAQTHISGTPVSFVQSFSSEWISTGAQIDEGLGVANSREVESMTALVRVGKERKRRVELSMIYDAAAASAIRDLVWDKFSYRAIYVTFRAPIGATDANEPANAAGQVEVGDLITVSHHLIPDDFGATPDFEVVQTAIFPYRPQGDRVDPNSDTIEIRARLLQ